MGQLSEGSHYPLCTLRSSLSIKLLIFCALQLTCGWDFLSCVAAIGSGCLGWRSWICVLRFHLFSVCKNSFQRYVQFLLFLFSSLNGISVFLSQLTIEKTRFFTSNVFSFAHCFQFFLLFRVVFFAAKPRFLPFVGALLWSAAQALLFVNGLATN